MEAFDRMTSSSASSTSSTSSTSSVTSSSSVEDPEAKRNNTAELSLLTEEKLEEDELLVGGAAAPPPTTESVLPSLSEQGLLTPTRGRAFRFAAPSSNDLAESDLEVVQMLASYTEGQLAEKMKQLQSWAYSLGLQEGRELERGRALNVLGRRGYTTAENTNNHNEEEDEDSNNDNHVPSSSSRRHH